MRSTTKTNLTFLAIAGALFLAVGCRAPIEDFDEPGGDDFDAAVDDDAGPGQLCPESAPDLFNNSYSPYVGGEDQVDLEVVGYSFFKCPHCADFWAQWEAIFSEREDIRARVRFYFHHFPFDYTSAWDVHATTVAAGNQGMEYFWQLHDYIFSSAYNEGIQVGLDDIRAYCADALLLDMDQFEADLADQYTYDFLAWDKEQGRAAGITGTPSVFVCGEKIGWTHLEEVIDGYLYGE